MVKIFPFIEPWEAELQVSYNPDLRKGIFWYAISRQQRNTKKWRLKYLLFAISIAGLVVYIDAITKNNSNQSDIILDCILKQ